ncbi:MAG: ABC transporter ATP-binding protein [Candidatus Altiarchaeales archaeon]|nr:ABC transporter ATP-binding protein [Candidatus Altiarchaeales archaeon]
MPNIEVRGLCKSFGSHRVLKDVSFTVKNREYVVVLGSSGCGKTTLLKCIAGLYDVDSGSVFFDGVDYTDKRPEERNLGFFFQHYALFSHMTVRENVGYSLTARGLDKREIDKIVDENLSIVGLSSWSGNYPRELSGGMQQRAALARVLATKSKLLLLDEPLNALDSKIASILRSELKTLSKKFGWTVIHVTPNQEEALELADRIILIKDGVVEQVQSDVDSYLKPKTSYGAYFIGESNFLKAAVVDAHSVKYNGLMFSVSRDIGLEGDVLLAARPEKILFERHERNTLEGVIEAVHFLGKTTRYDINYKGKLVYVETSKHPKLKVGDSVELYFPPDDIMVYPLSQMPGDEVTVI